MLIPFVLWSVFYSAISIAKTVLAGGTIDWFEICVRFVTGKASAPFYYIIVLIQLTVLTPFFIRIIEKGGTLKIVMWLVTPLYLIYLYSYNIIKGEEPYLFETGFFGWSIFYCLGIFAQIKRETWRVFAQKYGRIGSVLFTVAFSVAEAFLLLKLGCSSTFASSQIKISSFFYAGALICCLCRVTKKERDGDLLSRIGDCSYGIFYIHCFILIFVERFLRVFGIDSIWILYFILTWLFTSIISYAIVRISNLMLGRSESGCRLLKWIGFV